MKIIDTHTHIIPDKIARIVAEAVAKELKMPLYGPMTADGLSAGMAEIGTDASVTFCIAEKPSVVVSANNFLMSVCDNRKLIGLGSIHPDFEDCKGEIERLRKNGIKGIKAHSLFQGFYVDEPRMHKIYEPLGDDMILYLHAGKDPGRETAMTSPDRLAKVLDAFPKLKVVAAHFGGLGMLADARKYLVGRNLYLDTSWTPTVETLDLKEIAALIKEHGADKVMFASDYPWADTRKEIDWVMRLPLSDADKECIFWKNAARLFGLAG